MPIGVLSSYDGFFKGYIYERNKNFFFNQTDLF